MDLCLSYLFRLGQFYNSSAIKNMMGSVVIAYQRRACEDSMIPNSSSVKSMQ